MILVALGANLSGPSGASPLRACRDAAEALAGISGLRLLRLSPWYVTAPVPASDQPDYVNGVARLEGRLDPAVLLALLQSIEGRAGRIRGAVNAARTLDLDIVDMDGVVRTGPDPVLPHPRAHQRAFVLKPLRDVAPGWVHPGLGRTVEDLLADLPRQAIRPA